jgi:hypothetical protein
MMMSHSYRVGNVYRDRAGVKFEDDELLRWLHHERTIANTGGVRWRDFLNTDLTDSRSGRKIPAYFVLMTVRKRSQYQNPWEDVITATDIRYWGDAKIDSGRSSYSDFRGNQRLAAAANARDYGTDAIPPFLHFTKYEDGWVQFNGLGWLTSVNVEHFTEGSRRIENLVIALKILDVEDVPVDWLKERSSSATLIGVNLHAPAAWQQACDGILPEFHAKPIKPYSLAISERAIQTASESFESNTDPISLQDGRARVLVQIYQRQGQVAFRRKLLRSYEGRCAVTGCTVIELLEACHIRPYRGLHTNDPRNGLLLRSDIHTLFDQGLLSIKPDTMTVTLSQALKGSEYEYLHGTVARRPANPLLWPNAHALGQHFLELNSIT